MALIAYDPNEKHEWDHSRFVLQRRLEAAEEILAQRQRRLAKTPGDAEAAASVEDARKDVAVEQVALKAYEPGPAPVIFQIGHILEQAWVELEARRIDLEALPSGSGARFKAESAWRDELVRWGVKGHKNLFLAGGAPAPFSTEPGTLNGLEGSVVSKDTMALYAASRCVLVLAIMVYRQQSGGPALKNG